MIQLHCARMFTVYFRARAKNRSNELFFICKLQEQSDFRDGFAQRMRKGRYAHLARSLAVFQSTHLIHPPSRTNSIGSRIQSGPNQGMDHDQRLWPLILRHCLTNRSPLRWKPHGHSIFMSHDVTARLCTNCSHQVTKRPIPTVWRPPSCASGV